MAAFTCSPRSVPPHLAQKRQTREEADAQEAVGQTSSGHTAKPLASRGC